jgi:hypothetical protein
MIGVGMLKVLTNHSPIHPILRQVSADRPSTGRFSLRRTTVGKSERQLLYLIIDLQEGSSGPPPPLDLHWLNTHNGLRRIRLNTSKVSTSKCQSSKSRGYTSKSRP